MLKAESTSMQSLLFWIRVLRCIFLSIWSNERATLEQKEKWTTFNLSPKLRKKKTKNLKRTDKKRESQTTVRLFHFYAPFPLYISLVSLPFLLFSPSLSLPFSRQPPSLSSLLSRSFLAIYPSIWSIYIRKSTRWKSRPFLFDECQQNSEIIFKDLNEWHLQHGTS